MSLRYCVLIEEIQKIKTFLLISKTKTNILSNIEEDILILISKIFIYINEYKDVEKLYLNEKFPFYQNNYKIYNNIISYFDNLSYENQDELIWENNRYIKKKSLYKIDTVFHLAALIGIPYSYISPLAYIKTNVEGTYNILEAAKENNVNQTIITSTSETYGSAKKIPMNETHSLNAQSPYAASKIAADQTSLSYHRSFGQNVKIVRPFNTYGPRQSARAVIPTIISQLLGKNKNLKLGNVKPTRDYTYVEDLCDAFYKIANSKKLIGNVTNVGTNNEISIKELSNLIMKKLNIYKKIEVSLERKRKKASEVDRLVCDNRKLLKNTKWKVKTELEDGLIKTINWVKDNREKFKDGKYNI